MKNTIIGILIAVAVIVLVVFGYNKLAYADVEEIESKAGLYVKSMNMEIVNYDGFSGGLFYGGFCWYKIRDSKGYLYEVALTEWRGEIHLYNMKCLNAVSN